jgi:hypothetical protein
LGRPVASLIGRSIAASTSARSAGGWIGAFTGMTVLPNIGDESAQIMDLRKFLQTTFLAGKSMTFNYAKSA